MDDRPLGELLRDSLPSAEPADDFTERVIGRISRPSHATGLRWPLAAVLALLLLAAGWVGLERHEERQVRERREAVVELQRESEALAAELDTLRQRVREDRAVVYLGGSEEVDVVLDLASLPMTSGAKPRPISHDDNS